MTSQIIRGTEVSRPTPDRVTSSVLDHATVTENSKFGYRNNEGMWVSYNCLDLLTPTATCPAPQVGYKTFSRAEWQPAFEFAVHGGVECSAVGLDKEDQAAEIKRVFERSEGKGVEQALLYTRFEAPDSDSGYTWDAPVDLTPSGGISLVVALAILEGDAAANYAGLPTIHMPRAAATVLQSHGLITWKGDKAYTSNGSKVAIGGGYDDPTALASGAWTLFATGEIHVEKSEQIDHQMYVIPGDGSGEGSDENGLADNTVIALVERMYRVTVDCYLAKATGNAGGAAGASGGFGD